MTKAPVSLKRPSFLLRHWLTNSSGCNWYKGYLAECNPKENKRFLGVTSIVGTDIKIYRLLRRQSYQLKFSQSFKTGAITGFVFYSL